MEVDVVAKSGSSYSSPRFKQLRRMRSYSDIPSLLLFQTNKFASIHRARAVERDCRCRKSMNKSRNERRMLACDRFPQAKTMQSVISTNEMSLFPMIFVFLWVSRTFTRHRVIVTRWNVRSEWPEWSGLYGIPGISLCQVG